MKRVVASWSLCALALVTGLFTAALSAKNRERGDELDQLERWCEAQSRRNELARVELARREWILLGATEPPAPEIALAGRRSAKGERHP